MISSPIQVFSLDSIQSLSLPLWERDRATRSSGYTKFNEAETGSLALRLTPLPHEASPDRVSPSHARSATCQTNIQGEHLTVYKIDQARPATPGYREKRIHIFSLDRYARGHRGTTFCLISDREIKLKSLNYRSFSVDPGKGYLYPVSPV